MWVINKYKQSDDTKGKEEPLVQIVQSDIDTVPVVLYKGEEIKGKVRVSFDWKTDGYYHKSGPYIHIEHVEDSTKCVNTKIIQHNHPIVKEVKLFVDGIEIAECQCTDCKNKDESELLSTFSTEELVEALKLKEDVQIAETTEDAYKISLDLMKVNKHVLVINNCNPQLVERNRRIMEAERLFYAGGCNG